MYMDTILTRDRMIDMFARPFVDVQDSPRT